MNERNTPTSLSWSPSLKSRIYGLTRPASELFLRVAYASRFYHWAKENAAALLFPTRFDLFNYLIAEHGLGQAVDYLEFGVYYGESMQWWGEHNGDPASRFFGFDVFTGLPDKWLALPEGTFTTQGQIPTFDDPRLSLKVGLFQDTLEKFMAEYPLDQRIIIHLDADLYSSTLYALTTLAPKLRPGTVILFDELGSTYGMTHEFRALCDFETSYRIRYRVLGGTKRFLQTAIEII